MHKLIEKHISFFLSQKYLGKSLSKHILGFLITNIKDKFCMMKYTFTDKVHD